MDEEGSNNGYEIYFKSDGVRIVENEDDLGLGTLQIDSKLFFFKFSSLLRMNND